MISKIGIVIDGSSGAATNDEASHADIQRRDTAEQVFCVLTKKYQVEIIEIDEKISERLANGQLDIVFNLSTGTLGESRQSQIPALLEMLGIPYVGSGVLAHALALNKAMAKQIFVHEHVSTPAFQVFKTGDESLEGHLKFPLMVKPACEGSGFGIHKDSLVMDQESLQIKVRQLLKQYEPPVLVEEFIEGREFTVGIIGNGESKRILPIMEIDFKDIPEEQGKFYTYEVKNDFGDLTNYYCPADLNHELETAIKRNVSKAFDVLGCRDIARVDVRVKNDMPYIIEINSLPGLKSEYSDLPKMALQAGLTYEELITEILQTAIQRLNKL